MKIGREEILHIDEALECLSIEHGCNRQHPRKYFSNLYPTKFSFKRHLKDEWKTTLLFGNILDNAIVIFRISPSNKMAPRRLNFNRLKTFSWKTMKMRRSGLNSGYLQFTSTLLAIWVIIESDINSLSPEENTLQAIFLAKTINEFFFTRTSRWDGAKWDKNFRIQEAKWKISRYWSTSCNVPIKRADQDFLVDFIFMSSSLKI